MISACRRSGCIALLILLGGCSNGGGGTSAPAAGGSGGTPELDSGDEEASVEQDAADESDGDEAGDVEAGPCVQGDAGIPSPPTVEVPAGEFTMGCNDPIDTSCEVSESPLHKVTLSGFLVDKHEVTMAEYKACIDSCVCSEPAQAFDPKGSPSHPVVGVTLDQAGTYCTWIGRRLPTEAEWEKAARGTDGRIYPWGNTAPACDQAAFLGCAYGGKTGVTFPVGTFSPKGDSPYGAQDMAGNVWEWVTDWYGPYDGDASVDPEGPSKGTSRLWRGGGYLHDATWLRTSARFPNNAASYHALGFRCVKSL
ncbi:MAG: formylglycine-generating enzyme family protein [Deltaproteobacteria bacterium]|nr:formylglycine-generating enzyme family protein [Deltaproteobacteria bacterium]